MSWYILIVSTGECNKPHSHSHISFPMINMMNEHFAGGEDEFSRFGRGSTAAPGLLSPVNCFMYLDLKPFCHVFYMKQFGLLRAKC